MTASDPEVLDALPLYGEDRCTRKPVCEKYTQQYGMRLVGTYVGRDRVQRGQKQAAVLDLRSLDYDAFLRAARKVHKGNAVRDAQKTDALGLWVHEFEWRNHIPDVVEVNHSKEVRSGGSMTAAYRRDVEEMGGAPDRLLPLRAAACPVHWTRSWGVFQPRPGHRNGDVTTDEQLVAYVKLKRQGNLAIYSSILGHGDYLRHGVMYRLHFAIVEWLTSSGHLDAELLDLLLYGAIDSGNDGLQMWKKRCLFRGAHLVVPASRAPEMWKVNA